MNRPADLVLPATLTHPQAPEMARQLHARLQSSTNPFVLDASALTQFDSSALAVLLGACRLALQRQVPLQIVGLPQRAMQLAQLYGLSEILQNPVARTQTH